jgi:hypothetical protein
VNTLKNIAEALKTTVTTTIAAAVSGDPTIPGATVSRVWDVIFQTPEQCQEIQDRRVYVIPIGKEFREAADRANDRNVYSFGIAVTDRIPGEYLSLAEEVSLTEWFDDAIEWVSEYVLDPLTAVTYSPTTGAFLESSDWREPIKRGIVRQFGLFWSEIDIEFFIDEPNT